MENYLGDPRIAALYAKGGIMFFDIERPERVFRGMVLLSPVNNEHRRRAVYIKEYKIIKEG